MHYQSTDLGPIPGHVPLCTVIQDAAVLTQSGTRNWVLISFRNEVVNTPAVSRVIPGSTPEYSVGLRIIGEPPPEFGVYFSLLSGNGSLYHFGCFSSGEMYPSSWTART